LQQLHPEQLDRLQGVGHRPRASSDGTAHRRLHQLAVVDSGPAAPASARHGVGSDVATRIAAPMWGGLGSLTILTLLVIPAIYVVWRSFYFGPPKPGTGTLGQPR